jgi:Cd2+/Zn2+-exporting ATPase
LGTKIKNNNSKPESTCCTHDFGCRSGSTDEIVIEKSSSDFYTDTVTSIFKVVNMDCADEIKTINDALWGQGIFEVRADLMASTIQIIHQSNIEKDFLKNKINATVVKVIEENSTQNQNFQKTLIVVLSGAFLCTGLFSEKLLEKALVANVFYAISIIIGGTLIFPKALKALKRKSLEMNVLMTFAVIGALIIKQYSEAATVVFLFSLSELLESLSVQRARNAIRELLKLTPQTAFLLNDDNSISEIRIENININQKIRVKAGEIIPLDGVIISGNASIDQATLTGESVPIFKSINDTVFAGTINQDGGIDVLVSKKFNDTKISHIIKLVAESQSQRAPAQQFVDKFARVYTPFVFVIAILTYLIPVFLFGGNSYEWFYKALVLLVIACPCALVISTPISIVSALTSLARKGVLIKGGASLEMLGKLRAIALDKTGTLTEGRPEVKNVEALGLHSKKHILEIAASIESRSTHPFAKTIMEYSASLGQSVKEIENFKNLPGKGIEATIDGHIYFLSNHKYVKELNLVSDKLEAKLHSIENESFSIVIIGHKPHHDCNGELLGYITIGDKIRQEASHSIKKIKSAGIKKVIILSGDNQKNANKVSLEVGSDIAFGDLLPEDKVKQIENLIQDHKYVAMIGDGVNDAPAMAKASLGIAMGGIGSGTALETSDVTLMTDDLNQVAVAIKMGRRTLHVIKFNITLAIITKLIFLVLTMFGFANLWMAIIADTGATLIVILNSLRLLSVDE